jgi:putative FmdB family regulatory protein
MPLYAFECARCGSFDVRRPFSRAADPASCPTCNRPGRRIFTPPLLAVLPKPTRRALELEEKSAHEPEVVTEKRGRPLPRRHEPHPPWVLGH